MEEEQEEIGALGMLVEQVALGDQVEEDLQVGLLALEVVPILRIKDALVHLVVLGLLLVIVTIILVVGVQLVIQDVVQHHINREMGEMDYNLQSQELLLIMQEVEEVEYMLKDHLVQ